MSTRMRIRIRINGSSAGVALNIGEDNGITTRGVRMYVRELYAV